MSWISDVLRNAAASVEPIVGSPPVVHFATKRVPSERQHAARLANAMRIAAKVSAFLETGHRVFNEDGDELTKVSTRENGDLIYAFRDGGNVIMFLNDRNMDNGAMERIGDYNASFSGWTFFHPKDVKPLKV
jgi:hypothetical protein